MVEIPALLFDQPVGPQPNQPILYGAPAGPAVPAVNPNPAPANDNINNGQPPVQPNPAPANAPPQANPANNNKIQDLANANHYLSRNFDLLTDNDRINIRRLVNKLDNDYLLTDNEREVLNNLSDLLERLNNLANAQQQAPAPANPAPRPNNNNNDNEEEDIDIQGAAAPKNNDNNGRPRREAAIAAQIMVRGYFDNNGNENEGLDTNEFVNVMEEGFEPGVPQGDNENNENDENNGGEQQDGQQVDQEHEQAQEQLYSQPIGPVFNELIFLRTEKERLNNENERLKKNIDLIKNEKEKIINDHSLLIDTFEQKLAAYNSIHSEYQLLLLKQQQNDNNEEKVDDIGEPPARKRQRLMNNNNNNNETLLNKISALEMELSIKTNELNDLKEKWDTDKVFDIDLPLLRDATMIDIRSDLWKMDSDNKRLDFYTNRIENVFLKGIDMSDTNFNYLLNKMKQSQKFNNDIIPKLREMFGSNMESNNTTIDSNVDSIMDSINMERNSSSMGTSLIYPRASLMDIEE